MESEQDKSEQDSRLLKILWLARITKKERKVPESMKIFKNAFYNLIKFASTLSFTVVMR